MSDVKDWDDSQDDFRRSLVDPFEDIFRENLYSYRFSKSSKYRGYWVML